MTLSVFKVLVVNLDTYWVGQKVHLGCFSHKIKDTFFILTNNFIDLDILSMLAISWGV